MNAELREAVERMCTPLDESRLSGATAKEDARCMAIIAKALRDQEAEIARLRDVRDLVIGTVSAALDRAGFDSVDDPGEAIDIIRERAEKSEALLRDVLDSYCASPQLHARITAHLGGEHV